MQFYLSIGRWFVRAQSGLTPRDDAEPGEPLTNDADDYPQPTRVVGFVPNPPGGTDDPTPDDDDPDADDSRAGVSSRGLDHQR